MAISIKTLKKSKKNARPLAARRWMLEIIEPFVPKPGVSTGELDRICNDYIATNSRPFPPAHITVSPKSVCISINEVVCHGIPDDDKLLKDGDIVNIDVGLRLKTFPRRHLENVHRRQTNDSGESCASRKKARIRAEDGETWHPPAHLGAAIQKYAEGEGFSVVREYCGHGIGRGSMKSRRFCTTMQTTAGGTAGGHDVHHRTDAECR